MLSTRILLLPAVCTAMVAGVAQKHDLFPPQADAILSHPGAMDSLLVDWDRDGDVDIVTYFPLEFSPQRAKVVIKFWRNDGRKPT